MVRIETLLISEVVIGERHRKNLGDLSELAASIRAHGLLQPIGITADRKLIFGHRRLEASKLVPLEQIDARVFESLDDAVQALQLERDENTCRKDFTRSEAVALGRELEKLERQRAQERQAATQAKPGEQIGAENFTAPEEKGYTRDKVGAAIGMSGVTYQRAKAVVEAAEEDPEQFGHLVEQMDETGKVEPAYQELKKARDAEGEPKRKTGNKKKHLENIQRLAADGHRASQIAEEIGLTEQTVRQYANEAGIELPDGKLGKVRRINARRVIETTVDGLAGSVIALNAIKGSKFNGFDAGDAKEWAESLGNSMRTLKWLRAELLEIANGNQ